MTFGPIIKVAQSALPQRLRGLGRVVAGAFAALLVVVLTASNLRAADDSLNAFIANLNGPVNAIAYGNGITYLGGAFSTVTFNSGSMANLSDSTGLPDPNWPVVTGQLETYDDSLVDHIISDGSGGWYISGNFTTVGGVTRNGLAHILSNETLDPNFNANADSRCYECMLLNGVLYAAGEFNNIGGAARSKIAALNPATGAALSTFNAGTITGGPGSGNGTIIWGLDTDGTNLYIGGQFTSVNGTTRNYAAAVSAATGALSAWNPNANTYVYWITYNPGDGNVYVGGGFSTIGGATRNDLAAITTSGTATAWNPNMNGAVWYTYITPAGVLYACGSFTTVNGGTKIPYIASFSVATANNGTALTWNCNANNTVWWCQLVGTTLYVGGDFTTLGTGTNLVDRNYIGAVSASTGIATSWAPSASAQVYEMLANGTTSILAGGPFSTVSNGVSNVVAVNSTSGAIEPWTPTVTGTVDALALSGTTLYVGGTVTNLAGETVTDLGALNTSTGAAVTWAPALNGAVSTLLLNGTTLYAGGAFTSVGGSTTYKYAAAWNTSTGAQAAWNPVLNGAVDAMALNGSDVFLGGAFSTLGGAACVRLGEVDGTVGTSQGFNGNCNNTVSALYVGASELYAGGSFTTAGPSSTARSLVASWDLSNNALDTTWNPDVTGTSVVALNGYLNDVFIGGTYTKIGSTAETDLAAVSPTSGAIDTAFAPAPTGTAVNALYVNSAAPLFTLFVGGSFTAMQGSARDDVASFDLDQAPTAIQLSGTTVINNSANGTVVGNLTTTDPNPNDTFTYTLTSSAGGLFGISGSQLVVANTSIFTNPPPASYSITIETTDADGQSFSQAFTITVTVVKTVPTITWAAPASIVYGTALSATQLDATANVAGTFAYTPALGTVLQAGASQGLSVTFTPTDTTDYSNANATTTITVTPALLTVTANNASRLYKTANPAFTVSYSGFENGDTAANLGGTLVVSTTATLNSATGPYPITATGLASPNYTFKYVAGTLTIAANAPVITWAAPANIVYGTALSATQLDATANVPGTFAYTPALGTVLKAGANQVLSETFTPTDTVDYTTVTSTVTITVTAAPLTVTASNSSMTYGGTVPTLSDTITGFVNGDTISVVSGAAALSTTATATSTVGTYPITAAIGTLTAANYSFSFVAGTMTVNAAVLTVTANNASMTYGGAVPALGDTITGYVNGQGSSVISGSAALSTTATASSAAGTYPITAAIGTLSATNYTFTFVAGTMTVNPAALTITASSGTMVYGGTVPVTTFSTTGLVNSDAITSVTESTSAASSASVGTYPVTPSAPVFSHGAATDYTISYVAGNITITKAVLTVNATAMSKVYGTAMPTLTYGFTGFQGSDTSSVVSGTPTLTSTAQASSAVGNSYTDTVTSVSGLSATNYSFAIGATAVFTITPAPLTITAGSASMTYGGTVPTITAFTTSGLVNSDVITSVTNSTSATSTSPVGSYVVTASAPVFSHGAAGDYTISYVAGSLTIGQAVLTVNATAMSKVYGAAMPTLTYGFTGFQGSDTSSVVSGTPTLTSTALASSAVGNGYTDTVTSVSGLSATNYSFAIGASAVFTITPAPLTITAGSASMSYGGTVPTITAFTTSGLVNSDVITSVTNSTSATSTSPVGSYVVTASAPVFSHGAAGDYTISYVAGSLTIGQAVLTVNATAMSKVYGAAMPTLTYGFTGFQGSDTSSVVSGTPTLTSTALASSAVGNGYTDTVTSVSGLSATNYSFAIGASAVFTITPAPLTITAGSASMSYGGTVPTITAFTTSGLVNSDVITSVTNSTSATSTSPVGSYVVTASAPVFSHGAAGDYTISYVAGSLTIGQAVLTVNATAMSKVYGAAMPTLTYGFTGFQGSDTSSVVSGTPTLSTTATSSSPVGNSYTDTVTSVSGLSATNYSFAIGATAVFTITPAPLTITAGSASMTYGGTVPTITAFTTSGLVNSDVITSVTNSTSASSTSPVGSYAVTASAPVFSHGAASDYTISYVAGSLTIGKAVLTVNATAMSNVYGAVIPALSYSFSGFQGTDTSSVVSGTPTLSTTATSSSPVGNSYTDTVTSVSGLSATNYSFAIGATAVFTITPAPLTITAGSASMTYGGTVPTITAFTTSGLVNSDVITSVTNSTSASSTSPVGSYAVTASAPVFSHGAASDYTISYVAGSLTIGKAVLTVNATAMSNVYGAVIPALSYSFSGFQGTDTSSVVSGTPTLSTTATSSSPVGNSYTDTVTSVSGLSATNYSFAIGATAVFTITPAPLTITAGSASMTYGGTVPTITAFTTSGLVNSDVITSVTNSTSASSTSPVGSYAVTASAPVFSHGAASDYTISYVAGSLTIGKAVLTVNATAMSNVYGAVIPALSYSFSGFQGTDTSSVVSGTPTLSTTATSSSPVGNSYTDTVTSVSGLSATNYSFAIGATAVFTITPAPLTITAGSASMIYGGTVPTITAFTSSGLVNSDVITSVTNSTSATSTSPVGSYAVTASAPVFSHGAAGDYTISYVAGSLTIGKAALTVNATAMSNVYGAVIPALSYSFSGFQGTDTSSVVSGTPTLSTTATSSSPVGNSYTDTVTSVSGLSATNYSFAIGATAVFTITPAPLTITAGSASMTYGGTVPTITAFTSSGLVNSDVITSVTNSTSATSTSPVGSYAVTASAPVFSHGAATDYTISYVAGNITITKAVLTVNASAMSKVYGAAMPTLTYSFTGFQGSDTSSVVSGTPTLTSTAQASSAVGNGYTDTVTSVSGLSAANYSFAIGATAVFTITPAPLTITAGSASMTYGGTVPTITAFTTSGLVNSDVITSVTNSTSATSTSPVGSYAVTASAPVFSHGAAGDYTISYVAGSLTIGKAALTVNATAMSNVYGAVIPALSYSFSGFQGTDTSSVVSGTPTLSTTATSSSPVGNSYTDTVTSVSGLSATNYSFAIGATAVFTITPAPLTITAGSASMTYGGTVPTITAFTSSGLVNSDVITSVTNSTSATSTSPVGSYAVTASAPVFSHGAATDYTISYVAGNITITKAVLTVNASAMSKVYGAAMPTLTYSFTGFQGSDTSSVVSGTPTLTSTAQASSAVGNGYTDTVTSVSGLSAANYSFAIGATAVFTITPAPLTITAGSASMTYGGTVPTITAFTTSGLVNSDVITSVTNSTSATSTSPVGSYAVTASAPVFSHGAAGDYTISYVAGSLTIGQAVLTVNATAMSKVYGAAMPTLTYGFTGFQGSDTSSVVSGTPTLSTTATSSSPVGNSYTDTVTSVSGLSATNYSFAIGATAVFTITPAPLTITAGSASMTYGGTVPTITAFTTSGLVNSDVITSVTNSTSASSTSPVGSYAVTASAPVFSHGAASDYTISYVAGSLTIGKAVLTVNATAMSNVYGAVIPALSYSFSGFQGTDTSSVVSGTPTLSTTATSSSPVGNSYTDTVTSVSGLSATNYSFAIGATAVFTITPAPLTITAGSASMIYGGTVPTITAFTSSGLVNSDVITSVTNSTSATSTSPVGSYAVTASAPVFSHGAAGDYTISYVAGSLTIGKAALTVNATAMSNVYGAVIPALSYSFSGFQGTDTSSVVSGTPTLSTTATSSSPVGNSYTDTVTSVSGLSATNYSFAIGATAVFTITPAPLTITAGSASMTYGGTVPTITAFTSSGLVNSDVITSVTNSTSATSTSPVGSYAVTASAPVFSHGAATDYTISYVAGNITITKAVLTVNASAMSKVYGAAMPTLTYSFTGFQGSDTSSVVSGTPTLTSTAQASSAVGNGYTDTVTSVSGLSAANYSFAIGATAVFTITPAPLTITAGSASMTYGGTVPTITAFTTSGLVNSDVITSVTNSTSATSTSPVGSYAVTASAPVFSHGAAGDYTISYVAGSLTIGQAVLTVNATAMSKVYGAAMPTLTYGFTGFQGTDTSSVVSGTPTLTSTAQASSAVGNSYTDTVTSVSGLSAANYSFAIGASAVFTITPAPLTITAGSASMTYGGTVPTITAFTSSGLVNSDVITSVTNSTSATSTSPVGSYAVTASAPVFSHGAASDYTISYVAGSLTIGKAVLTVNATAMSNVYGAVIPALSYSFSGFQGTDTSSVVSGTPTLSTTATSSSPVGNSYTDTVTSVSGLSATNYSFAIGATAVFTITPAPLTITAGSASMTYGGTVPTITAFTTSGLVNSDVITSVTNSTSATSTSPVGSYAVTASAPVFSHGAAGDYTISYVAGSLTIGQAVLTVNATAMSKVYGAAMPTLTYGFTGFQGSDTSSVVSGTPTLSTTATSSSPVGNGYTDTVTSVSGLSATNYSFAIGATAVFTITPAPLTITAGSASMTYGATVPTITAFTTSGLVNSDVITSVTNSTSATSTSPVGSYVVTASAPVFSHGAAGDYTISYVAGSLTIGQAVLTVNATAMSKVYGAAMPTLTYGFTGFQGSDTSSVVSGTPTLTSTALASSAVGNSYTDTVTSISGLSATNYSFAIGATAVFTITPAPLTITAGSASMTYGGTVPTITAFTTSGLVNSDVITSVTNSTSASSTSPVGSYAVTASAPVFSHGAASDYTISYVAGSLTIGKAVLTVNATAMSNVYGAVIPALSYSFSGFQGTDTSSVVSGTPTLSTTATSSSPVGNTYTDTVTSVSGLSATNYSFAIGATAVFTITPAPLTITAGSASMTYGATVPTITAFTTSGLVNSDVITSVTNSTSATSTSPVGSYVVTASAPVFSHGAAGDYTISYVAGSLTIGQAVLTVNATAMSKVYGAAMPTLTYGFTGFQGSDTSSVVSGTPTLTSTALASSAVGNSYTDTVTSISGLSATNYSFAIGATAVFTITPAPLTITAGSASMTYGGTVPTITAFTTSGLVNSDVITSVTNSTSASSTSPVGSYAVTASAPVFSHGAASDYTISYVAGSLTIGKAVLTVNATAMSNVYGAVIPALSYSFSGFQGTDTSSVVSGTPTLSTTATSSSPVGNSYTDTVTSVSGLSATNYSFAIGATAVFTITPAPLTITAGSASMIYGGTVPTITAFTSSGLVNSDVITSVTNSTSATSTSPVGSYAVTASAPVFSHGAAGDYTISYVAGSLTIGKAALTVNATAMSNVYGAVIPALSYSFSGFQGTDTSSVVSGTPTLSTTATSSSPVGNSYTDTVTSVSGLSATNYSFAIGATAVFTITPAPLTITAGSASMTYGGTVPTITAFTSSGLVNSDVITSVTNSTSATSTSPVGSYAVTASAPVFSHGAASDYTISYVAGSLTIGKAVLTVNATAMSNVYGAVIPALSYSFSGFQGTDTSSVVSGTPTLSTTATSSSPVGNSYTDTVTSVSGLSATNYSFAIGATAVFTITPAPLTITAGSASMTYGGTVPTITAFTTSGLVNSDVITSVTNSTSATSTSPVGSYAVTASAPVFSHGAAGDYTISYVAGSLTIGQAVLTVNATAMSKVYGAAMPTLTYGFTGFQGSDTSSVVSGTPTLSTTATSSSPVGNGYTDTVTSVSGLSATNYSFAIGATAVFTITPAPLTITAGSASMTYGATVPTITAFTTSGLVNSDVITSVTNSTSATSTSPVGSYVVTASAPVFSHGAAGDYTISYVAGSLTIGQAVLTVNATAMSKVYGAAMPTLTYGFTGFQGSDTSSVVSGTPTLTSTALASSAVGNSYTDTVTSISGLSATNYSFAIGATAVFTITPAPLTITAGSASMTYGGTVPTITAFTTSGLVNSDVITSVTNSTSASSTSPVGSYAVTASAPVFSHGAASDYTISYVAGSLTIGKAVLTVNATAMSNVYGAVIPALSYSFSGFQGTDTSSVVSGTPTLSTTATSSSPVGNSYTDTVTSVSGLSATNYSFAIGATAVFTITPAPLTITAGSASMIYGGTVPTITAFTSSGLVNSDVITSVTNSTSATSTSPVGSYAVTASAPVFSHGAAGDYTISYVAGSLTIGKAALTVNATAMSNVYGAVIPALSYSFSGFQGTDTSSVVSGTPTLSTTATSSSPVGNSYTDTVTSVSGLSATNYSFAIGATAVFTITPAPLTITAGSASMTYGGTVPTITAFTSSGLVNSDVITSVTNSTSATSTSPVGSYAVTASAPVFSHGAASDYTISYVAGSLTIGKAVLTVNATAMSNVYGAVIPALSYSFSGFQGTDTSSVVSGTPTLSTTATSSSPVGNSYTDTVTSVSGLSATNYSFAIGATAVFTITPAPLTITAGSASMTYGGTVPTITAFTTSGLVNSDVITSVTNSTSATSTSPVGSYAVTASAPVFSHGAASDYTISYVAGSLTIGKAVLTVNATAMSNVYGAVIPALSYSFSGFQGTDTSSVVSGTPTLSTTATSSSPVGNTYTDTVTSVSGLSATNYSFAIGATAVFTITPAPLTITAGSASMTYGGTVPTITAFTTSGLVNSDVITSVTNSTSATSTSPVGSYAVTASAPVFSHGAASDYTISYVTGSLTIGKAVLTVNATAMSKVYGAAMPTLTYGFTGFQGTDTSSVVSGTPTLTSTALASSAVGNSYTDTVTSISGLSATNYSFAIGATAVFTITPAPLTITAGSASMTYGGTVPTITAFTTSGLVNSDVITSVTNSTSATSTSPVGSYAVTASAPVFSHGAASDYMISYVAGSLTIGKAVLTVNATAMSNVYGAVIPALSYSFSGFQGTDTSSVVSGTPTLSTTATSSSPVGNGYTDTVTSVSGLSATNYSFAIGATAVFTITPAPLTITAGSASMTYGGTVPTITAFTSSGLVNSDVITSVTNSTSATSTSPVGSYAVTASAPVFSHGVASDYAISYVAGSLTIGKAVLTVNATAMSKVYGAAMPTLTYGFTGFQGTDTSSVVSGTPTLTSTAQASSAVGNSYNDSVISVSGLSAANYSFAIGASAVFTITPAALTVEAPITSRPYGSANPSFSPTYVGLVNGDTAASLGGSPSLTTTATSGSNAGTYTIAAATGTLADANYTFSFVNGTLTVTKVALTVTATSLSMNYGGSVPALSYGITGFVNGDTSAKVAGAPTLSTTAISGSPAGPYPITILAGSLVATNYTFTMVNGTLTVNQAVLTVTPTNSSRSYGAANPNFSVNISGFINGDNYSVVSGAAAVGSSAVATSPVGIYPITASLGSLSATNYSFAFVTGYLTVTQAVLTVTADPAFMTYGAEDPVFTATFTGFLNSDNAAVVGGAPSFTSTDTSFSPVGYYTVVPSLGTLTATNYSFTFVNGVLTINPAELTIEADDTSMVVNTALPALTVSYLGFVGTDDPSVLSGTFQLSNNAQTSTPGQYAISITSSGMTADNYLVSLSDGILSVIGTAATVNMTPTGGLVDGDNAIDALSADGSSVLFTSDGENMPGQPNGGQPMLYMRMGGSVTQISQGAAGQGSMSGDGNYIAYIYPEVNLYSSPFEIMVCNRTTTPWTYTTESYSNKGALADDWCTNPMISDSGEYVAFEATSTLLTGAAADTGNRDIIYRDRFASSNQDRVLSLDMNGVAGTGDCQLCAISPDGRYIAFTSTSTTLLPGTVYSGTNPYGGGYLYDTKYGTLSRIDLTQSGGQPDDEVGYAMAFSADDHYLVFSSLASNLVPGVSNGVENIYRYDLTAPVGSNISRISVNADGTQGNLACYAPRISWDGRFVSFLADGGSFDPNDTNNDTDIYMVDTDPQSAGYQHMARVSLAYNGAQGDSDALYEFCMSRDASTIAWYSFADNIAPNESDPGVDMNVFELSTWVPAAEDPPPTGDG